MAANPGWESESAAGDGGAADLLYHLLRADDGDGEGEERMGIDEMLRRHAGEFGRWQLRHFVLSSTAWALEAFHTMVMIFADREPAWRCSGGPCPADPCRLGPDEWDWVGGPASSTVREWGLVCGDKYKVGLVQSGFFAGCMIGE
ncbi:putative organic cation/carnitine transporter 4 [Cocos nucifera]|nr:putative organic cation/carnitine transporter 4 [Cocos nucifera]